MRLSQGSLTAVYFTIKLNTTTNFGDPSELFVTEA